MRQTATALIHGSKKRVARKGIELRPGRKLLLGQNVRFGGLLYRVLGYGREGQEMVVHLGR